MASDHDDVSQLRRSALELALHRQQADSDRQRRLYEAILSNTPDLAYVWDRDHRFIYANEGLLAMWGVSWDEAIGRNCLELGYEPWHAAMHDREIEAVVATRQPIRGEVPFTGTFGRRIYDYILVPVIGADGQVEAVAGTTRDVTDRKLADLEREALLASERAARAEAEHASRVKEEFLAMLSHELRTPLNAVLGWAQVLAAKPPSPDTLTHGLRVIERNARMQAQLIADLLDMSRILSGTMRIDLATVDLRLVIEAALESVRAAADARDVALEHTLDPGPSTVVGDPARLQQIVWNLLANAIKFTPAGGRVRIASRHTGNDLEVEVSDTGAGITADFLPHVFERFRQADNSASRAHGGLGLGLAIVKQLVDLHGGDVTARSGGAGRGATFTVRLPVPPEAAERPALATPLAAVRPVPDLSGVRVLVVDDERDARDLAARILRDCGAIVDTAASVDAALATLGEAEPDVIVSDIGMPHRDGYAFMEAVRRGGVKAPAAAVTAFARVEDRTRALEAGYQTHLAKPVDPVELMAAVAALAHKTRAERDPR